MNADELLIESVLASWKGAVARATKQFADLSEEQAQRRVAPGRNRIIYLLGHLTAVHDAMIPLLRVGERLVPELDEMFIRSPDRAGPNLPPLKELTDAWANVNHQLLTLIGSQLSISWWTARHASVSEEDYKESPTRNRLAIILSRLSHLSYHLGQIALATTDANQRDAEA